MLDGGGPPTAGPDPCREGSGSVTVGDGLDSLTEDTTGSLGASGRSGIAGAPKQRRTAQATRNPHETKYNTGGTNILMEGRDMRKEGTIAGKDPANDCDMSQPGAVCKGVNGVY